MSLHDFARSPLLPPAFGARTAGLRRGLALLCLVLAEGCAEESPGDPSAPGNALGSAGTSEVRGSDTVEDVWFEECAQESGLRFAHRSGHTGERFLFPEIMGGGAALEDLDGDGDLDAYLVQSGTLGALEDSGPGSGAGSGPGPGNGPGTGPGNASYRDADPDGNVLFCNTGGSEGALFREVVSSGAEDSGYGMGVAVGDVDGDGDADLYVTNVGANALLLNESAPDTLRFTPRREDATARE